MRHRLWGTLEAIATKHTMRLLLAAATLLPVASAVGTTVDLGYSKYEGITVPRGISQWLGIRFAAPPVGELRFAPPQDPEHTAAVQPADKYGPACLATGANPDDKDTSEDCLFLDVQAPTNASAHAKLPVFVYIQGGGFNVNSNTKINASGLIAASDHGIVVVSFNYRVGPYGFLSNGNGANADAVKPNNGLRDQLKVLQWVQDHIAKFGGDPGHVVIGGSSAGAESVALHLTGNHTGASGLFHGAIAESPSFATMLTVEEAAYQYKQLATRLGCVVSNSLACLRNKTAAELQANNFNIPLPGASEAPEYMYLPTIDGALVPDYTYRLLKQQKFIRVPTIFGDDSNGGTRFAPRNTSTLAQSNTYMLNQYPFTSLEQLAEANELYPNPNATCPNEGCYWRQLSNVYGEARYMCPARAFTQALSRAGVSNTFAYRWNVEDPEQVAEGLGVPHTVELSALWGAEYTPKPPKSYEKGGVNERASPVMQCYWVSFIKSLDPSAGNRCVGDGTVRWAPWTSRRQNRLVFQTGGKTQMEPFGQALNTRCDFWAKYGVGQRHLKRDDIPPEVPFGRAGREGSAVPDLAPCDTALEQPLIFYNTDLSEPQSLSEPDRRLVGRAGAPFHAHQPEAAALTRVHAVAEQQAAGPRPDAPALRLREHVQQADVCASVFRIGVGQGHHAGQGPRGTMLRVGEDRKGEHAFIRVAPRQDELVDKLFGRGIRTA
ncbi:cholinesterase [Purpureocillium lavendulum]|uniref:Cholinesterase n=1 Tax=Purpureocillium lavendulum TaxID=1247861 RepID=A0AB34FS81_9HYPO|nr:cholinesterase [Purpureocillium lavendulum]